MKPIVTDLVQIAMLVETQRTSFEQMRDRLQQSKKLDDKTLDAFVTALATPIIQAIDCKACGNCCRALAVYLEERDVERLAEGLQETFERVMDEYISIEVSHVMGEWGAFKHRPCAFLRGNLCGVYAHRPQACRDYPALTPDFRWLLDDLLDNITLCPILYNVFNNLLDHADNLVTNS